MNDIRKEDPLMERCYALTQADGLDPEERVPYGEKRTQPRWCLYRDMARKGATPAAPGQRGFIGGSMAEEAVIVRGMDTARAATTLHSTIHGAGRNFGRKEAHRHFTREQMEEWLNVAGVRLFGGDIDESPMAYKRLPEVLAHHHDTLQIEHRLKPFAVFMAGSGDFDPYKD